MIDLTAVSSDLKKEVGNAGLEYLLPQLAIIRRARNLPNVVNEKRLTTLKFIESLKLINEWIEVVSVLFSLRVEEKENALRRLQDEVNFLLEEKNITSWKEAINKEENPDLADLLEQVRILREAIITERDEYLKVSSRDKISSLCGIVMYPYSDYVNLEEAIKYIEERYFGPNVSFNKKNKYTDAFILANIARNVVRHKRDVSSSLRDVEKLLNKPELRSVRENYDMAKYSPTHGFSERDVELIFKHVLKRRISYEERKDMKEFYIEQSDRYKPVDSLYWIASKVEHSDAPTMAKGLGLNRVVSEQETHKRHLLGLSFLDKHVIQDIIGNVPESSFSLFERVLQPFNELKQFEIFISTAQFEIDSLGLPEQAWIYDYTGIRTEVLRSTLLLISDRQPKFDLLEASMKLISFVLSGRVDRNDIKHPDTNYVVTGKLPKETWDYITDRLVEMLEEVLISEEAISQRIIREIFSDEDRSKLITSKKFEPAFQVDVDYDKPLRRTEEPSPIAVTIYAREDMDIQYRHVQAAGYPWYKQSNEALELLVADALRVRSMSTIKGNVHLRQAVYNISGISYILFYQPTESGLSTLAFREIDLLKEGINPVEVIYRPKKFLGRGPKKNQLKCILEKARATDPKDLRAVISNL